jgi:predicted kinase
LIEPPPPRLIAVGGLSGTGKSALARALAPEFGAAPGAVVLRSDIERKTLFGKDEQEKLPADAYAPDVTARVYASIADKARRAAAAGHGAIVDGVFAKPQERAVMQRSASALGVPFHGLFLDADLRCRRHRRQRPGELRPRRAGLGARRCRRHAGADARPGTRRARATPRNRVTRYARRRSGAALIVIAL